MVSVSGISKLRVSVEQVEAEKERSQDKEEVEAQDTSKTSEESVVKLFQVEGKSGDIVIATDFSASFHVSF